MFRLSEDEWKFLRSQFVTLETGRGKYPKYLPLAFTEQGVAMLSSVLNSPVAINVNIQIIRVFTKMRGILLTNKDILLKLEKLEKRCYTK
jgi:ORF6N domain